MEIINLGGRLVNSYLIKENGKNILIDTGYPDKYIAFENNLKKNSLLSQDIDFIFITHSHDDHVGFINNILWNSSAKLVIHEEAFERLELGENSVKGIPTNKMTKLIIKLMEMFGKSEHKFPPLDKMFKDRLILINEKTKTDIENILGAKIINTPGHTEGSVSLFFETGELFCGDAASNGFPSKNRISIVVEDMKSYSDSWKTIIKLNPKMIFPGHGKPFFAEDLEKNLFRIENKISH